MFGCIEFNCHWKRQDYFFFWLMPQGFEFNQKKEKKRKKPNVLHLKDYT